MGAPRNFRSDSLANKLSGFRLPQAHGNVMSIVRVEHLDDDEIVLIKSKVGFWYVLYSIHKVNTLSTLKKTIEDWCGRRLDKFIAPKKQAVFEETLGARFYKQHNPKDTEEWIKWAVPSGHEYAFLGLLKPESEVTNETTTKQD